MQSEGLRNKKWLGQPQSWLRLKTRRLQIPVSPVSLLKLLLDKQKQEQNK